MRNVSAVLVLALAMVLAMAGTALANQPPGDPLPVNGEPDCFGARVSHSASEHGRTPNAKITATAETIAYIESLPEAEQPVWADTYLDYYEDEGVSVRSIMNWIRVNCSDDPFIENP